MIWISQYKLILVLLLLYPLAYAAKNTEDARVLFHSGFEGEVQLNPKCKGDNGFTCMQWIRGRDTETGFTWPIKVLGGVGRLHLIGHDNHQASHNEIQQVIGHDDKPTQALYMAQYYKSPVGNIGQSPYLITEMTDDKRDLYISYWIKINKDYLKQIGKRRSWRTFFQWKTANYSSGDGFRLISYIYTTKEGIPYWHWQGDADPKSPIWTIDNKTVQVPIGKWFFTEFYWHWSENKDGRALWKINSKVIGDHYGVTTRNSKPINRIMLTQIYGSTENGHVTPMHQWVDDIEIWDKPPQ